MFFHSSSEGPFFKRREAYAVHHLLEGDIMCICFVNKWKDTPTSPKAISV